MHHYRKKIETWKLDFIERKIINVRRDLETGGGRTKNNKTEENYTQHESFNLYKADTHWTSWLVPMFGVANIVVSFICMYINNCLKNNFRPHGGCVAKFLGRFSFEPMQENSLLGLSSSTLTEIGGNCRLNFRNSTLTATLGTRLFQGRVVLLGLYWYIIGEKQLHNLTAKGSVEGIMYIKGN
ncbi:hypothetical protein V8G54_017388 [Vigna mungo]|uniref:Uncharacterized protein n=1 Tax=Vigna mungo TaxID=3915 RepID=A0AAQ3S1A7_VIGMU